MPHLLKTEPTSYSIDHLKKDKVTAWSGVRNYQARNMLRDDLKKGEQIIIYHSSCEVPAAVGVAEVVREGYPDEAQFDKKSKYYDPKATKENPRWFVVDIKFKTKFKNPVPISHMRNDPRFAGMPLLAVGSRLSVLPLSQKHFDLLIKEGG